MGEKRGEDISPKDKLKNKIILGENISQKIDYYLKKNYVSDFDVYNTFKEFFSGYLEINYEMTCNELLEETKKIFMEAPTKAKLVALANKLRLVEFNKNPFTQEELKQMLSSFKEIINDLLDIARKKNKKSFFEKLFGSKKEKDSEFVPEEIEDNIEEIDEDSTEDDKIEKKEDFETLKKTKQFIDTEPINKEFQQSEENNETNSNNYIEEQAKDIVEEPKKSPVTIIGDKLEEDFEVHDDWSGEPKKIIKKNSDTFNNKKKNKSKEKNNKETNKTSIISLISKAKKTRSKEKLKSIYKDVIDKYNSLEEDAQSKYYEDIQKIYTRLKK